VRACVRACVKDRNTIPDIGVGERKFLDVEAVCFRKTARPKSSGN